MRYLILLLILSGCLAPRDLQYQSTQVIVIDMYTDTRWKGNDQIRFHWVKVQAIRFKDSGWIKDDEGLLKIGDTVTVFLR